ncbi:MAG: hypothetical protein IPH22_06785 [Nitrosomonas sp.]|nr:hypothetical protein [Nitrosomonas sp.]
MTSVGAVESCCIPYTEIGKGWGAKDGVSVEKSNQLIANLECVSRVNYLGRFDDNYDGRLSLLTTS